MPINPPQPATSGSIYGSVEAVFMLLRSLVNDTFSGITNTPGEGRIVIDSAPFMIPLYNNALNELQRDLENRGFPSNLRETILSALPAINGPLGVGLADPTIQPWLGYNGFFDGTTLHANIALPANFLTPQEIWERTSVETNLFEPISPTAAGLVSRAQNGSMGEWDWRGDAIYFNGSTNIMDLRLRYYAAQGLIVPTIQPGTGQSWAQLFATIAVPWRDAVEPLALHMAWEFCASQLPAHGADDLMARYIKAMTGMAARMVRKAQRIQYHRQEFGSSGDVFGI
ncbi:MAG: hypothetical protein ACRD22_01220 [Terriglobia bacterium]